LHRSPLWFRESTGQAICQPADLCRQGVYVFGNKLFPVTIRRGCADLASISPVSSGKRAEVAARLGPMVFTNCEHHSIPLASTGCQRQPEDQKELLPVAACREGAVEPDGLGSRVRIDKLDGAARQAYFGNVVPVSQIRRGLDDESLTHLASD
jgi:hypothetical protein